MTNYRIGINAEDMAVKLLRTKGYKIVAARVGAKRGTGAGEIDIVVVKGNTLVFVEVKKRTTISLALESIIARQQARVYRAAQVFLAKYPKYDRFDCRCAAIVFDDAGKSEHLENAWGM